MSIHTQSQLMSTSSNESLVEEQAAAPVDDNMSVAGEEDPGAAVDTIDLSPTTAYGAHDSGSVAPDPGRPLGRDLVDRP